jgi:hypothetical protein
VVIKQRKNRDSSVGIATGYGLGDRNIVVSFPAGAGNFSLRRRVQTALGPTQPRIQWVPGAVSLWVKQPGHEADHSTTSSAEAKECVKIYIYYPNTSSWRGA